MTNKNALLLTLFLLCVGGCKTFDGVPTYTPTTTTHQFKEIISPKNDPFPSVGSILTKDGCLIGSGVLIAPSKVITAGHVIDGNAPFYFYIADDLIKIETTIVHPEYRDNSFRVFNDIGVVLLKRDSTIKPAVLIANEDIILKGQILITVGYGRGYKKYSLFDTFWYYGILTTEKDQLKFLPLKDTIWFGDSGGALFAFMGDELKIVGVISSLSIKGGIIYENSATNIQYYKGWINGVGT